MNTWKVKIPDRFNIELIVHIYLKLLVYEIVHHWPFITNLANEVDSVHLIGQMSTGHQLVQPQSKYGAY